MKLSDTRILITGGGRGIGNFIARGILSKVSKVIILDNDEKLLQAIPDSGNLIKYQCDVTDEVQVEKIISNIFETEGGINVCINNAGIIYNEPLINILSRPYQKHSIANWKKVIDLNLNSVFYVTTNVADKMIASKENGLIINISSISAQGNIGHVTISWQ